MSMQSEHMGHATCKERGKHGPLLNLSKRDDKEVLCYFSKTNVWLKTFLMENNNKISLNRDYNCRLSLLGFLYEKLRRKGRTKMKGKMDGWREEEDEEYGEKCSILACLLLRKCFKNYFPPSTNHRKSTLFREVFRKPNTLK